MASMLLMLWIGDCHFALAQTASDGRSATQSSGFDVVSIKPTGPVAGVPSHIRWTTADGFSVGNMPLLVTLIAAYIPPEYWSTRWSSSAFVGLPDWVKNDNYDIEAKVDAKDIAAWQNQGHDKALLQSDLRQLLKDRCDLVMREEKVDVPVFGLILSHPTAKLALAPPRAVPPSRAVRLPDGGFIMPYPRGSEDHAVTYLSVSMQSFAAHLSGLASRPVIDKTGLSGAYDFQLKQKDPGQDIAPSSLAPPLNWELGDLGLKLVPLKAQMTVYTIEHIQKPSIN